MADFFGSRHVLVVLCFFGVMHVYFCRLNMSIAIVSMSEPNIVKRGSGMSEGKNASRVYCQASSLDMTDVKLADEEQVDGIGIKKEPGIDCFNML